MSEVAGRAVDRAVTPAAVLDAMTRAVVDQEPHDDMAMVVLRVPPVRGED